MALSYDPNVDDFDDDDFVLNDDDPDRDAEMRIRLPEKERGDKSKRPVVWHKGSGETLSTLSHEDKKRMKPILQHIEDAWMVEGPSSKARFSDVIRLHFSGPENPFHLALYLISNSFDYRQKKTATMAFMIAKEFDRWVNSRKDKDALIRTKLDHFTRLGAFQVATEIHTVLFEVIARGFNLSHTGNEYFLKEIRKFLDSSQYKEAALCASKLQLHTHFQIEEIVLPLFLQDKMNLVESYIRGEPEQQCAFIKLLDNFCDRDTNVMDYAHKLNIPNTCYEKLHYKSLSKLAIRLVKLYDIPPAMCPNISNARNLGALRYLLYKRYIQGGLGEDNLEELLQGAVGNNDWLKEQLVDTLFEYNELAEAAKWARFYNLSDEQIRHEAVREARHLETSDCVAPAVKAVDENWDDDMFTADEMQSHYLALDLPEDHIHFVDTHAKLMQCVEDMYSSSAIIGLDSEWRPSFGTNQPRIALLQMATRDDVYLVDLATLRTSLCEAELQKFMAAIFCSDRLLKLGYGFDSDLQMLLRTFPYLRDTLSQIKRVVEISALAKQVLEFGCGEDDPESAVSSFAIDELDGDDHVGSSSSKHGRTDRNSTKTKSVVRGLSELVRKCLGKPLCKTEQMSDWERRPLRPTQITYAALDAYVLLQVYHVLTDHARSFPINLINLEPPVSRRWLKPSMRERQRAKAKHGKLKKEKPHKLPPPEEMIAASRAAKYAALNQDQTSDTTNNNGASLSSGGAQNSWPVLDDNKSSDTAHSWPPSGAAEDSWPLSTWQEDSWTLPSSTNNNPSRSPRELSVVVDSMLQGLAKQLRSCGVDVCVLENHDDHDKTVQISRKEKRVILTSGRPYEMIRAHVGDEWCFCVSNARARQQCIEVFNHFNIKVTQADIFTRCLVCNGDEYLQIPLKVIKQLWLRRRELDGLLAVDTTEDPKFVSTPPVDFDTVSVYSSTQNRYVLLQIGFIAERLFENVNLFFVCTTCGKVFWEGSHFTRVCAQFADILSQGSDSEDVNLKQNTVYTQKPATDSAQDGTPV